MVRIDLNADLGEAEGVAQVNAERMLLDFVSSVNIACGMHAGGPDTIAETARFAYAKGVAVGAHPSLNDRVGFGRRWQALDDSQIKNLLSYQVGALRAVVGTDLQHVKPHGALYNRAAQDPAVANAVTAAISGCAPNCIQVVLAGSLWERIALRKGLRLAREAFVDRAYLPDGNLAPRSRPDALVTDPARVAERAVQIVFEGRVPDINGDWVKIEADTLCIHGDTPGASGLAQQVVRSLTHAGAVIVPMAQLV